MRLRSVSILAPVMSLLFSAVASFADATPLSAPGGERRAMRLARAEDGSFVFLGPDDEVVGWVVESATEIGAVTSYVSPQPLPGWPISVGEVDATPFVVDLDGDGQHEVVVSSWNGYIYVFTSEGRTRPGWPYLSTRTGKTASIADLDGVGALEIVAPGFDLVGLSADGVPLDGWPFRGFGFSTPGVADLDCDGHEEVAASDRAGRAYVVASGGGVKPGWPFLFADPTATANKGPALGDVDADGTLEVAFPLASQPALYLVSTDGMLRPGFPIPISPFGLKEGVSMADADGDGAQDLVFQEYYGAWALDGSGQPLPGWPIPPIGGNSPPAIGDLDGDGRLEFVWGTTGGDATVFAVHADGSPVPGWPVTVPAFTFNAQATLGDVDGDGGVDVVLGGSTATFGAQGRIYAWHADGTLVPGFPFDVPEGKAILDSSVTITDLDQDGDVDLLVGAVTGFGGTADGRVFAFDLGTPYDPSTMHWPTLGHDPQHTARYERPGERFAMRVKARPEQFLPDNPPGRLLAQINLPAGHGPLAHGFRIVRMNCKPITPIQGRTVLARAAGSVGPDRIVAFDGAAIAAAVRELPPPASGVLRVEFESEAVQGRWFVGTAVLKTMAGPLPVPELRAFPSPLDLGAVQVGASGVATLTLSNAGELPLKIYSLAVEGAAFAATASRVELAPGEGIDVTVTFTPPEVGVFTGEAVIVSNDPKGASLRVPLSGTGAIPLPIASVTPGRLDFGVVPVGFSHTAPLQVMNAGLGLLTVSAIHADDPSFSGLPAMLTVPPTSSAVLSIEFSPAIEGEIVSVLRLTTNDPTLPEIAIPVSGEGEAPATVFATLRDAGEVRRIDADGIAAAFSAIPAGVLDLLPTADGSLWVTGFDDGSLWSVDLASGAAVKLLDVADGLAQPSALTYDASGRLLIANAGSGEILGFDTASGLFQWADLNPDVVFMTGLALLPTGEVAVCDAVQPRILAVSAGGARRVFAEDLALVDARDCAVAPDGRLYVAYDAAGSFGPSVLRFEADGSFAVFADGTDGLTSAWGIAIDPLGRVYVADVLGGKVFRFQPDGSGRVFSDLSPAGPYGVAVTSP